MFTIKSTKAVRRDLKKLPTELIKLIESVHFKNIREDPFRSYQLGYAFKGLRSYHFSHRGTSFRIVCEVFESDQLVVILMIGPRESFYERLRRRLL